MTRSLIAPPRDPAFVPFALPDMGEREIAEVVAALRSGWITTGPRTRRFEAEFAAFIDSPASPGFADPGAGAAERELAAWLDAAGERTEAGGGESLHAVAVSSATAGLHLALEAVGIGPGDEVIVPTYTFTATAEAVRYLGANPVFVDLDPTTLSFDLEAVGRAVTPRTRAVIPVHFAGLSVDMTCLLDLCMLNNLRVIEDAAHALPTTHRGRMVGSLSSDATVFSFYATKTVAAGEGGMLVTRDHGLAERARVMRLHGISRDAFDRYVSRAPSWHYDVIAPGFKYNMTDVSAAIARVQLRRIFSMHARRRAIADAYDMAFADLPVVLPPRGTTTGAPADASRPGTDAPRFGVGTPRPGADISRPGTGAALPGGSSPPPDDLHAWYLYVLRLRDDAPIDRDGLVDALAERAVGSSVHFIPLHRQPCWRDTYRLDPTDFPMAEGTFRRAISLPIYSRMSDADVERVIAAVRSALGGR